MELEDEKHVGPPVPYELSTKTIFDLACAGSNTSAIPSTSWKEIRSTTSLAALKRLYSEDAAKDLEELRREVKAGPPGAKAGPPEAKRRKLDEDDEKRAKATAAKTVRFDPSLPSASSSPSRTAGSSPPERRRIRPFKWPLVQLPLAIGHLRDNFMCFQPLSAAALVTTSHNLNKHITGPLEELVEIYAANVEENDEFRERNMKKVVSFFKRLPIKVETWPQFETLLESLPRVAHLSSGLGDSTQDKVFEALTSGVVDKLEGRKNNPFYSIMVDVSRMHGIGPAAAKALAQTVTGLADLRARIAEGRSDELRMVNAADSNCKVIKPDTLKYARYFDELEERIPRAEVEEIGRYVRSVADDVYLGIPCILQVGGSYRRGKSTSGDVDIIISPLDNIGSCMPVAPLLQRLFENGFMLEYLKEPTVGPIEPYEAIFASFLRCGNRCQVASAEEAEAEKQAYLAAAFESNMTFVSGEDLTGNASSAAAIDSTGKAASDKMISSSLYAWAQRLDLQLDRKAYDRHVAKRVTLIKERSAACPWSADHEFRFDKLVDDLAVNALETLPELALPATAATTSSSAGAGAGGSGIRVAATPPRSATITETHVGSSSSSSASPPSVVSAESSAPATQQHHQLQLGDEAVSFKELNADVEEAARLIERDFDAPKRKPSSSGGSGGAGKGSDEKKQQAAAVGGHLSKHGKWAKAPDDSQEDRLREETAMLLGKRKQDVTDAELHPEFTWDAVRTLRLQKKQEASLSRTEQEKKKKAMEFKEAVIRAAKAGNLGLAEPSSSFCSSSSSSSPALPPTKGAEVYKEVMAGKPVTMPRPSEPQWRYLPEFSYPIFTFFGICRLPLTWSVLLRSRLVPLQFPPLERPAGSILSPTPASTMRRR